VRRGGGGHYDTGSLAALTHWSTFDRGCGSVVAGTVTLVRARRSLTDGSRKVEIERVGLLRGQFCMDVSRETLVRRRRAEADVSRETPGPERLVVALTKAA
jgi:hypothetical protein